MYSQIRTSMLDGICAMPVQVEVDISMGMPVFDMVGYLSPEVREAKERVRTALHNCGILLPAKRITVNLSPANIRKTGTGFDLPIAVALLVAMGLAKPEKCVDTIFSGELNLSGQLLPVRGVLPMVSDGVKEGIHKFVVPADNLMESRLVQGADVCGFSALESVIGYLQDGGYKEPAYAGRRQNTIFEKSTLRALMRGGVPVLNRRIRRPRARRHWLSSGAGRRPSGPPSSARWTCVLLLSFPSLFSSQHPSFLPPDLKFYRS